MYFIKCNFVKFLQYYTVILFFLILREAGLNRGDLYHNQRINISISEATQLCPMSYPPVSPMSHQVLYLHYATTTATI